LCSPYRLPMAPRRVFPSWKLVQAIAYLVLGSVLSDG
jgi:hypothetical protein